jgi:hypothetical protein
MHDAMKMADDPEVVAENLIEAATAVSPRRRYTCGKVARQVSVLRFPRAAGGHNAEERYRSRWKKRTNGIVPEEKCDDRVAQVF